VQLVCGWVVLQQVLTDTEHHAYLEGTVRRLFDDTSTAFVRCPNTECQALLEKLPVSKPHAEATKHSKNKLPKWMRLPLRRKAKTYVEEGALAL